MRQPFRTVSFINEFPLDRKFCGHGFEVPTFVSGESGSIFCVSRILSKENKLLG
jgi:hypothetical protein